MSRETEREERLRCKERLRERKGRLSERGRTESEREEEERWGERMSERDRKSKREH